MNTLTQSEWVALGIIALFFGIGIFCGIYAIIRGVRGDRFCGRDLRPIRDAASTTFPGGGAPPQGLPVLASTGVSDNRGAVGTMIIVLLVILGLFWIAVGTLQLAVGLMGFTTGYTVLCGLWNFGISVINMLGISDVLRRYRRTVKNLTLLAVGGAAWGLFQLVVMQVWLQALVIPLYVVLGVLVRANKDYFYVLTPGEQRKLARSQVSEGATLQKKRGLAQMEPKVELPTFNEPTAIPHRRTPQPQPVELKSAQPHVPQPWYFSPPVKVLTFLFATPLWTVLVLVNKRERTSVKVLASLVAVAYVFFCMSLLTGRSLVSGLLGPARIEFGTGITGSGAGIALVNTASQFEYPLYNTELAWMARLGWPVGTTTPRLVLSLVENGGERVIAQTMLPLADPSYTIVYGRDMTWTGLYLPNTLSRGTYSLRLMNGDTTLAYGEFTVR
jgi:hypothetical protein